MRSNLTFIYKSIAEQGEKMLGKIHHKLGTAGLVVAVMALVAALTGAAFAAGGLTKSQEKQVKKIVSKEIKSHPGPAGPKGDPGAPGPAGPNGVSPLGTEFSGEEEPEGEPCEERGGVENKGVNTTFVCNGKTGPTETKLPAGQSLKGLWQLEANKNPFGFGLVTVSFPLSLGSQPLFRFRPAGAEPTEECPGNAEDPKAASGYFCFYTELALPGISGAPEEVTSSRYGGRVKFNLEAGAEVAFAFGSWAVTE